MKYWIALFLWSFIATPAVEARLGETEAEITDRFGKGTVSDRQRQTGAETLRYSKNGFQIDVAFLDGKSVLEVYHKTSVAGDFPEADIETLLDAYKESKINWRFDRSDKLWKAGGKVKYIAFHEPGHSDFFFVKDAAACELLDKKAAAASKGF